MHLFLGKRWIRPRADPKQKKEKKSRHNKIVLPAITIVHM
jgi:hypothetical protein